MYTAIRLAADLAARNRDVLGVYSIDFAFAVAEAYVQLRKQGAGNALLEELFSKTLLKGTVRNMVEQFIQDSARPIKGLFTSERIIREVYPGEKGNLGFDNLGRVARRQGMPNETVGGVIAGEFAEGNVDERVFTDIVDALGDLLDKKVRNHLGKTRLAVLLGDQVAIATDESGKTYAHYGESGEQKIPTVYLTEQLLNYLLENSPESLALLLQIEMNRQVYRAENGRDPRTSQEVVDAVIKESNGRITQEDIRNLRRVIARAELSAIVEREKTLEPVMVEVAKWLEEMEGRQIKIFDSR